MYKKAFKIATIAVFAFAFFISGMLIVPRKSDVLQILSFYNTKKVASSNQWQTSDQKRKGVRKDAFFTQSDGSRLQYRIDSESSTLFLHPVGNKFDIVEDLQGIKCCMQEKVTLLPAPVQQVKFFRAEEGRWSYAKQEFNAKSVNLSLLKLPGTNIPATTDESGAFLRGVASGVCFSFCGKKPNFHAEKFQASMKSGDKK